MDTKKCGTCKIEKSKSEFNSNRSNKDGLADSCGECSRATSRQRYLNRRPYYIADASRRKKAAIAANSRRVWEYLLNHPCVDCGESDPVVLEFDHRENKIRAVSSMVSRGAGWTKISEEIAKCDVRCANCHRRKTAQDFGWRILDYKVL